MEEEQSIPDLISEITELNDISEFMKDEDIDEAMATIIKIISKPNIPANVAAPLIVLTQALSSKIALKAKYHMLYGGFTEDNDKERSKRKNTLMTMSAELEKLSNALKYLAKT